MRDAGHRQKHRQTQARRGLARGIRRTTADRAAMPVFEQVEAAAAGGVDVDGHAVRQVSEGDAAAVAARAARVRGARRL